jgi:hypothetical protein
LSKLFWDGGSTEIRISMLMLDRLVEYSVTLSASGAGCII